MRKIMVGVSSDNAGHPALEWASDYARQSHSELELVHVIDVTWGIVPDEFTEQALLEAERGLREKERSLLERHPYLAVRSVVLVGSPVEELARAAKNSDLLVIGAERRGGTGDAGRRTVRIAAGASTSVVVVPDGAVKAGRGIVVGVDGSANSAAAVQFAAREADRFGEELTVLYSWTAPEPWSPTASMLWPTEPLDEDRIVVAEAVAGLAQQYPDLAIQSRVVAARPENALFSASVGARMLVLGSRGRHGFTKFFLGSVSEELVSRIPCVIAIVRTASEPKGRLG